MTAFAQRFAFSNAANGPLPHNKAHDRAKAAHTVIASRSSYQCYSTTTGQHLQGTSPAPPCCLQMDLSQTLAAVQRDIEQLATDAAAARAQCTDLQSSIDASKATHSKLTSTIDLVAEELALTLQEHSDMQCCKQARAIALQAMHKLRVKAKDSVGTASAAALLEVQAFESEASQFQADYCADHLEQQAAAVASEHAQKSAQLQAFKAEAAALHSKYKAVKAELSRTQRELQEKSLELQGLNKDVAGSKESLQAKQHQLSELLKQCRSSANGTDLDALTQAVSAEHLAEQQSAADEQLCKELGELMDESRAVELEQALSDELAALREEATQTRCCIAVLQHEITNHLHPPPLQRHISVPGGPRGAYTHQQQAQMPRMWQPAAVAGGYNRPGQAPVHGQQVRSWPGMPVAGRPAMPTHPSAGLPSRGMAAPVWHGQPLYTPPAAPTSMPSLAVHESHTPVHLQQYSAPAAAPLSPGFSPGRTYQAASRTDDTLHNVPPSGPSHLLMQPGVPSCVPVQTMGQPVVQSEVRGEPQAAALQQGTAMPGPQQLCEEKSPQHGSAQSAPSPSPACSMYSVQEPDDEDTTAVQHASTTTPSMAIVPHSGTSNSTCAAGRSRTGALVTETVVTHTVRQSPSTVKQVVVVRQVVEGLQQGASTPSSNTTSVPASPRLVMVHERVTEVRAVSPAGHHTQKGHSSPLVASMATSFSDAQHGTPMAAPAPAPANIQTTAVPGFMMKQGNVSSAHHMAASKPHWLHQPQYPQTAGIGTPAAYTMHTQPHVSTPAVQTPAVQTPGKWPPTLETPAVQTPAVQSPAIQTPAVMCHSSPSVDVPGAPTPGLGSVSTHHTGTMDAGGDISKRDEHVTDDIDFSFIDALPRARAHTQLMPSLANSNHAIIQQQTNAAMLSPGFTAAGQEQRHAGRLAPAGQQVHAAAPASNMYGAAFVGAASTPQNFAARGSTFTPTTSFSRHQPACHTRHGSADAVNAATAEYAVQPAHASEYTIGRQGPSGLNEPATAKAGSVSTGSGSRGQSSGDHMIQLAGAGSAAKPVKNSQAEKPSRGRGQRRGAGQGTAGGRANERNVTRAGKRAKTDAVDQQPQLDMFGGGMAWTGQ